MNAAMARIQIIGGSGSGKTTLGQALATRLDLPFVDLDDLYWEPGWREVGHDELKRRVAPIAAQEAWLVVGNYGATAELLLWPRLTTLVVLDLPYPTMMWRILHRSLRRAVRREACCNGNFESLHRLLRHDAPLRYLTRTWRRRHARYVTLASDAGLKHARVVYLARQADVDAWLAAQRA
jgi:adenylate kinase family enzyme